VHLVAKCAPQTVNRRSALHRPALDDERRNLVYLVWPDEVNLAFY
jgi:hypothetical protein